MLETVFAPISIGSLDSLIEIMTGYKLECQGIGLGLLAGARYFPFFMVSIQE
jgi:hypothetical protein